MPSSPADLPPPSHPPSALDPGPFGPPGAADAPARAPAATPTGGVPTPPPPPPPADAPPPPAAAEAYERAHVHDVYAAIAPHFSATRHRPWPLVAAFLAAQPPGAVGLDVGCGNGKYLALHPHLALLGCDRSAALAALARGRCRRPASSTLSSSPSAASSPPAAAAAAAGDDALVADGLALPFRRGAADFAVCVAVVHHLSTRERRVAAVRALLACVAPGRGRVLVYVWALEQAGSRRGWAEGGAQDLLVPWVVKAEQQQAPEGGGGDRTFQRYYHLYRRGELEEDVVAAGGAVLSSGYEKDNWWAIASPGAVGDGTDTPSISPADPSRGPGTAP